MVAERLIPKLADPLAVRLNLLAEVRNVGHRWIRMGRPLQNQEFGPSPDVMPFPALGQAIPSPRPS